MGKGSGGAEPVAGPVPRAEGPAVRVGPHRALGLVRRRWSELVLVAFVGVVYAPTYLREYAWSDDFPLLSAATGRGGPSVTSHIVGGGRPILALVFDLSFGAADTIRGLGALRLLGVLGVALTGVVALVAMVRAGLDRRLALPTAVGICLLPTYQTWAAWAASWPFGYATALAGAGGLVLLDAADGARPRWRWLLGASLVVTAFLVYQPAAMFVWVPIAIELALSERGWPEVRARLVRVGATVVGAMLLAVVVAWLVTVVTDTHILERAAVLRPGDVPAKSRWFVSRLLVIGARPFLVDSPRSVVAAVTAGPVLLVLAAGLVLRLRRTVGASWLPMAASLVAMVPLAVAPSLVTRENQFDFRLMAALAPMMLMFLVVAVQELLLRASLPRVGVLAIVAWMVVGVATVSARHLVDQLFISPSVAVEQYFERAVADFDPAAADRVTVVVPREWPSRGRLGIYSTSSDLAHGWVAEPLTQLKLEERGVRWPRSRIETVADARKARPHSFVLDTTPFRDGRCVVLGVPCPAPDGP